MTGRLKLIYATALFMLCGASLNACVSVLPEPAEAPVVYRLSGQYESVKPSANAKVIRIDRPASSISLDTKDILVTPDGRRMAAASMASWADPIPAMVQDVLIAHMGESSKLIGLLPASGARTQTRVHVSIKNFEAKFDQGEDLPPLAVVRYDVSLADASDRKLLGTFSASATSRARALQIGSIVEAMGLANEEAMTEIIGWLENHTWEVRS